MTTIAIEPRNEPSIEPSIEPLHDARAQDALTFASFARQPVLNRDGMLCGYELKVRAPEPAELPELPALAARLADDTAPDRTPDPQQRVAQAIVDGLVHQAVRGALTGHVAYVDASRAMLLDDALLRLSPERFMFELSPALDVDDELIARIVQLHGRRYRFVLDEVTQPTETFAKLLPYVEVVKIDVAHASRALLPKLARVLKSAGKLLIASSLEAQADFEAMHELGFDRFQGYYFAQAHSASSRRVSAPRHALLNLLQLLAGDPTVAQLEAELKLNPVLVMHLMKLANSGGMNVGHKVTTLREAINATGTDRIARWTQLLLYADGRKVALEDDPLLQLAATRARFMELAIERLPEAGLHETDAAFLTGVFSFVDAVFGGSLESTLNVLALPGPIRAAILHRDGALGALLSVIEALERGQWQQVRTLCERLQPLTLQEAAQLALTAGAWAGVADRSAQGLERVED